MRYQDLKSVKKNTKKAKPKNSANSSNNSPKTFLPKLIFFVALVIIVGWGTLSHFGGKAKAALNPITLVSSTGKSINLAKTDDRTNVLILGSDRRADDPKNTPARADTILVASIGHSDGKVVLISIPRDLWVSSPVCGRCKITEVYAYAYAAESPSPEGVLQKVVEEVLGIPIHYYGVVNFALFEDIIDTLGGITVDVENAFDDYEYPVEGKETDTCGLSQKEADELLAKNLADPVSKDSESKENKENKEKSKTEEVYPKPITELFPCRYEHVHFEKGTQKMDGKTALKYVRSRHGTNNEDTDFARSARQQRVIMAIKQKAFSLGTLLNPKKIQELYSLYKDSIITNVDFATLQGFYLLSQKVNFSEIKSVVLDDRSTAESGGLLYSPVDTSLYGGKYVLLPLAGNYSQIHAYIQKFLFGD